MFRSGPLFFTVVFSLFTGVLYAQITSIPDVNFEQALIDLGIDSDGEVNGQVLSADLITVNTLNVSDRLISNLTGIEDFVNLKELNCRDNLLTSLSVNDIQGLEILDCSANNLSNLSVKNNTKLKVLRCSHNGITEIRVTDNPDLEELNVNNNLLTAINVKSNPQLALLDCSHNQLDALTVTDNWNLKYLDFSFNQLVLVYLVNNINLEYLDTGNNPLTTLNVTNLGALKTVHIVDNDLLPALYFDNNRKLEYISCRDNDNLATMYLKGADALTYLNCSNNALIELDVSQNLNLESLFCQGNKITALDLSLNSNLAFFQGQDNQLVSLNLKNGQNDLMKGGLVEYEGILTEMEGMNASGNEDLQCIDVDDEEKAQNSSFPYDTWLKDDHTFYAEDCQSVLDVEDLLLSREFRMFPNPATYSVSIVAEGKIINEVLIYSPLGNQAEKIESGFDAISLVDLKPGLYYLRITLGNKVVFKKLIKI